MLVRGSDVGRPTEYGAGSVHWDFGPPLRRGRHGHMAGAEASPPVAEASRANGFEVPPRSWFCRQGDCSGIGLGGLAWTTDFGGKGGAGGYGGLESFGPVADPIEDREPRLRAVAARGRHG
ncbi:hypothetical protein [Dietzia aurantiaca]|uniref:Uncharacterized protein n=1 Tax=Dietzia aurantiaca TaxID=983873 RepID=A0ABV9PUV3_9ACTN